MKAITLLYLVLMGGYSLAQQSLLKGIVSIHNSETKTGKRQYVTNAEVDDDFGKATPRLTDNQGRFTLMYVGIPEKASISFQVKKKGLQVVDQTALSAVAGQATMVKISMAYPDSINEYRRVLFQVGKTEAEKRLEHLVESHTEELANLRKNETQNEDRIKKLEGELARLGEQRKQITEQAEALARKYAPLNLDDAPKLFRTAFNLFQKGYFDSAYLLLQQANLDGRVDAILVEQKKIISIREELKQRDSAVVLNTDDAKQALQLKADFHKTKYEFDSTAHCYEQLIRLDTNNGNYLLEYAHFLTDQNSYDPGIWYTNKALAAYRRMGKTNKEIKDAGIAKALHNLATLYSKTDRYAEAEIAYQEALEESKKLAKSNAKMYETFVAGVLHDLGTFYSNQRNFVRSEAAYLEALKIYTKLARKDAVTYNPEVAYTQAGLGVLYRFKADYTKAETVYAQLLQVYRQLASDNPQLYEPVLATMQDQAGMVYLAANNFGKAEEVLLESLRIRKQLAVMNPQAYQPDLGSSLDNLGSLYSSTNNFAKAESMLQEALATYRQVAQINPQAYRWNIANTQEKLAVLYSKNQNVTGAEAAYSDALQIFRKLAEEAPQTYELSVAHLLYNQGVFYNFYANYPKAEAALLEALTINNVLAKTNAKTYEPAIALTQASLGDIYRGMANYQKAETLLLDAVQTYERLVKTEPQAYKPYLANIQDKLANVYKLKGEGAKAEATYRASLETYKLLVKDNAQAYEPEMANVMINLGSFYMSKKDYAEAEKWLNEALLMKEKWMNATAGPYIGQFLSVAEQLVVLYATMPATTPGQAASKAIEDKVNKLLKTKTLTPKQQAYFYGNISWYLCLAAKFGEVERYARKGLAADRTQVWIKVNLAHSLLFQDRYEEALKLYKELKQTKNPLDEGLLGTACLADLDVLEKSGITHKKVDAIRAVLK